MQLILASSSPYRAALLNKLKIKFEAIAPDIDEAPSTHETPIQLVQRLGREKASVVAKAHPEAWVIGSDQVAFHNGQIIGKPGERTTAINQLLAFSEQTIEFYTSIVLMNYSGSIVYEDFDKTQVQFRNLSRRHVEYYVDQERPFNCAGSFKSEGLGVALFSAIKTEDPNALIGLPLIKLVQLMVKAGIDPLVADF